MRILTYKRTHTGDPDRRGRFGIHDCMGSVRALRYDAVIGIGGTGSEPQRNGIARKLTWIGIGPRRTFGGGGRAELVEFEHFLLLDAAGPDLVTVAPHLAELMYGRHRRFVFNAYPASAYAEALALLEMAKQLPSDTTAAGRHVRETRCRSMKRSVRRCPPVPTSPGCRSASACRPSRTRKGSSQHPVV